MEDSWDATVYPAAVEIPEPVYSITDELIVDLRTPVLFDGDANIAERVKSNSLKILLPCVEGDNHENVTALGTVEYVYSKVLLSKWMSQRDGGPIDSDQHLKASRVRFLGHDMASG